MSQPAGLIFLYPVDWTHMWARLSRFPSTSEGVFVLLQKLPGVHLQHFWVSSSPCYRASRWRRTGVGGWGISASVFLENMVTQSCNILITPSSDSEAGIVPVLLHADALPFNSDWLHSWGYRFMMCTHSLYLPPHTVDRDVYQSFLVMGFFLLYILTSQKFHFQLLAIA